MDRAFLAAYEAELDHIRGLASEFAALHPNVARNLSLDSVPCPDPYVERLLEGVAFLAARTALKIEAEGRRFTAGVLEALWPDLAAPAPAMGMGVLQPGPQVQAMPAGHRVPRGSRLCAVMREGLTTRATYTTAQDVTLWPIALEAAEYLPDRGALAAAGLGVPASRAEAAIRLILRGAGPTSLSALTLDRLDLCFAGSPRAAALFDAVHGSAIAAVAHPARPGAAGQAIALPAMVGVADDEGLTPRVRQSFEGFRLLRDYFLMPERFHFLRLNEISPAAAQCGPGVALDLAVLLSRPEPQLAGLDAGDFRLFATPLVNLFEKECNFVDLDPRATAHPVHADRARTRDFEIYRLLRVADADREGDSGLLCPVHAPRARTGEAPLWWAERRPRRPATDEISRGQMRSSYAGDDLWISVSQSAGAMPRRLDIRALCTNRDLPILDDTPRLTPEGGEPILRVDLIAPMRRPQPALTAADAGATRAPGDDTAWRLVAQLSSSHLSLAEAGRGGAPLNALLALYADRGDPALARHARAVASVSSRPVIERLALPGPLAFGRGTEITLDIDETLLAGASHFLLSALLDRLFARYASVNAFVRTRTRLVRKQEEMSWPMRPGCRARI
ncbi:MULTISPECIES: type VI secretion system baseplate subunit TssF [unclassified Paracoccus (in: a-proteobacteria)]|uniref:type VI secretion system baseplate subunit TssF n=1 Tax=unclassified Paracoccus (in: a-proteobacteria) TaxID=2688777 RepID=UPI0015FEF5F9|nr:MULTISPECIES: type VI secretion system baseplate subunit TssF [unclassified Paracoccus (in: a-proteobacteria)]MBB1490591.1 type VI secretion system baseplate subunit TssF [Paracoccus sp. MC1854]MBB1499069.1 type VI secretion system baseplate subunit TssF [Paracoccus sp. MC1862]QQO46070.1 type VI secretion system baseplate subunit TssF [Paracoccus sp. MC1862]